MKGLIAEGLNMPVKKVDLKGFAADDRKSPSKTTRIIIILLFARVEK